MARGVVDNNVTAKKNVPDGGWGWIIVFSSFMIHFIMDGITYSMSEIYLHPMMEVLHSSRARVSAIFAILPAVTLATGPITAVLVQTYGCRKITIVGACLAALGFTASSLYANIWLYYMAIGIVGGLGFGMIYGAALISVLNYFEEKQGTAMGIAVCGSGLGTMVFAWIMPYVINSPTWFDYNGALLNESAVIFVCVIFGVLMIPLPEEASEKRRLRRKLRAADKQQAYKAETGDDVVVSVNEQKRQLLPSKDSSNKQQLSADDVQSIAPSDAKHEEATNGQDTEKEQTSVFSKSHEQLVLKMPSETSATADDSHPVPLNNQIENEHQQHSTITDEKIPETFKPSFMQKLSKEVDFQLLTDGVFALIVLSNFLISLGFNVPYNFANDLAIDANIVEHRRHWIIMSIGISNCFGRVIIGLLKDRKWISSIVLYNVVSIIAGLATMAAPLCGPFVYFHVTYGLFFGFFSGGYVCLSAIIVEGLVGREKKDSAIGLVLLFQGLATGLGTPTVGAMRDAFSNFSQPYFWPYFLFGGFIVVSGVILFPIVSIYERRALEHQLKNELSESVELQTELIKSREGQ